MRWIITSVFIVGLLHLPASVQAAPADPLCFPQVAGISNCVEGRLLTFWEQNGSLPVFGYPLSAALPRAAGNGTFLTQLFERNRLEVHPENRAPYDVLLGRLGADRLAQLGRDPAQLPRAPKPLAGCLWVAQTGHNICDQESGLGFKTYWSSHGLHDPQLAAYQQSVALWGLPLTEAQPETDGNGHTLLTQWFERARFEYHPEMPRAYKVLLGRLGVETGGASPAPGGQTGIEGQVTIGPNCPGPDTGDPACASKPYQAQITILTTARATVQSVQSDSAGHFLVLLNPGTYILAPVSGVHWPRAAEQTVTVQAGQITHVTVDYDTGIR